MAKKSEDNTFTAQNTFTAGQFNVGPFEVTNLGSLSINMSNSNLWERYLIWSNNSAVTSRIMFGGYGNGDTANYAWIGIGDVNYTNAQYIFAPTNMRVPLVWSLDDLNGNSLVWSQAWDLVNFGRLVGTTKIRSGNVDLIHKKGSTDYKILDESNYSQYLPTTSKWTYGFVYENKTAYDLNTDLLGPDKGKLAYNYTGPSYWTNGPTGMEYGTVLQIWGSGSGSSLLLMPQLAFDVNHNVAGSTRYMYFRTPNNLGYGDSSNWKRVVTADENVAVFSFDDNNYPTLKYIDGNVLSWLRSPMAGFLPNTQVNLASGGASSIGTSAWCFQNAYIANVYANNYFFGNTGTYLSGDANYVGILNNGTAKGLKVGGLLVSSNYANHTLIPTNGIFSSGRIQSNDSMLVGYSGNVAGGMLGYGLYYDGTFAQGLGSEYSSGALVLYKMLNPNKGKAGYNVPRATTGTPTYLKINSGYLTLGVGENKAYTAGEAVTVTEYTVLHQGNGFYLGVPTTCVPVRMSADKAALATGSGYLEWWNSGAGWVNHRAGKYIVNGGSSSQFLKGDGSLDSTAYLPLSGGTISAANSVPLIINNSVSSGTDCFERFNLNGTASGAVGFLKNKGTYLYNYTGSKYLFLRGDGAYFGTAGSEVKLPTLTDLANYLPLTGGTLTGQLMIKYGGNVPLVIDNIDTGSSVSYISVRLKSANKTYIGWSDSYGPFLQDANTNRCIMVKSDGAYFGTNLGAGSKLLTTDDNVITAVGGENYVNVSLSKAAQASAGAAKYLEWWDSTPGWYNFITGYIIANGFIRATTSLQCDGQAILQYFHNGSYHNAINVNKSDGAGYVMIGNYTSKMRTFLLSNASDILHYRSTDKVNGTPYRMWDEYNLPSPVKSTSTKKVTDIQVVDALPATQESGDLYLVVK